jgi:hypothetical protein
VPEEVLPSSHRVLRWRNAASTLNVFKVEWVPSLEFLARVVGHNTTGFDPGGKKSA